MNQQSLIVLRASLQLYEKQSVPYHGLVLAYIMLCPSTTGRRGYSSRLHTGSCFLNHSVDSQSHRKKYCTNWICNAFHIPTAYETSRKKNIDIKVLAQTQEQTVHGVLCWYNVNAIYASKKTSHLLFQLREDHKF